MRHSAQENAEKRPHREAGHEDVEGPPPPPATPPTDSAESRVPPAASAASASATTEQIPIWGDAVPDVPPAWGPKMAFGYTYKRGRGEHYCVLCAKFADENHCNGAQRQQRIKDPEWWVDQYISQGLPLVPGMPPITSDRCAGAPDPGSVNTGGPRPQAPPRIVPVTNQPAVKGAVRTPLLSGWPSHLPIGHPDAAAKNSVEVIAASFRNLSNF